MPDQPGTPDPGTPQDVRAEAEAIFDGFVSESHNGVVCSIPDTGIDTPPHRTWCSRCQSLWRRLVALSSAAPSQEAGESRRLLEAIKDYAEDLRSVTWVAPVSAWEMNRRDHWLADQLDALADAALSAAPLECSCHSGSVCGDACKAGKHHSGCAAAPRPPETDAGLVQELRQWAEEDVRGSIRDVTLAAMFGTQFVQEPDLRKWGDLMDRAADALDSAQQRAEAAEKERDELRDYFTRNGL